MKKILSSAFLLLFIASWINISCNSSSQKEQAAASNDSTSKKWWKEAVIYQLYPRSFKDSDGDGIGDLKGIISELDYLKSLGVDAVWLNPIYGSPNDDNGYDVSDYRGIMKDFGTMEDFDNLLKGMHERGIKLVMDLVVNHSSDEHEWFKQAKSSRNNPYRDYYHWWNAERGKPNYRYSLFDVHNDAWKLDTPTNSYYLHYFSRKQPDLNWENPKLRQEVYGIMKFWLDKGIDGFRMDAFQFCAKDTSFPAFDGLNDKTFIQYYAMQNPIHDYLKEMNKEVLSKYDVMSVAEGAGKNYQDAHDLVDEDRHELNMAYAFDAVDLANDSNYSVVKLKKIFSDWDSVFANKGWLSVFLANHDNARMVTRFGSDRPEYRDLSSKMLNTFILSMRGTPYCYYGDELGMVNIRFNKIEDYNDMPTLNQYKLLKETGGDIGQFLKMKQYSCRDNGRTPMQWDATANAGFTTGKPWLKVNPNYVTLNREAQERDPNSCLNYFRKMIQLRKENEALVYGKYTLLDKNNSAVYAYTREWKGKEFLILLNFSEQVASYNIGMDLSKAKVKLNNYTDMSKPGSVKPFEAIVYELK
jgi:oligo-1,6-glucosidase